MARTSWFAVFFLGLCLSRLALAGEPASIPPPKPQQIHQTVERAIGYLQTESASWLKTRQCMPACHHVPMPLWKPWSEAERQVGTRSTRKFVAETTESLLGSREKLMASEDLSSTRLTLLRPAPAGSRS